MNLKKVPSLIISNNVDLCHHPSLCLFSSSVPHFSRRFIFHFFIYFSFPLSSFLFSILLSSPFHLLYFYLFLFLSPFSFRNLWLRRCLSFVLLKLFQRFTVLLHAPFKACRCAVLHCSEIEFLSADDNYRRACIGTNLITRVRWIGPGRRLSLSEVK